MLPQLYINYKLQTVAHLPVKSFMYKIFNTFIDDIFAFIVKMPLKHKIMTLRDDLVFFGFVYQWYVYPADKTRTNEFGFQYGDEKIVGVQDSGGSGSVGSGSSSSSSSSSGSSAGNDGMVLLDSTAATTPTTATTATTTTTTTTTTTVEAAVADGTGEE
jgi:hypothetical protein